MRQSSIATPSATALLMTPNGDPEVLEESLYRPAFLFLFRVFRFIVIRHDVERSELIRL